MISARRASVSGALHVLASGVDEVARRVRGPTGTDPNDLAATSAEFLHG